MNTISPFDTFQEDNCQQHMKHFTNLHTSQTKNTALQKFKFAAVAMIMFATIFVSNSVLAEDFKPFKVIQMGDTDYKDTDTSPLGSNGGFGGYGGSAVVTGMFQDINQLSNVEFIVHVGDIMAAGCTNERLTQHFLRLNNFQAPFIYAVGDNESLDCGGEPPFTTLPAGISFTLPLRDPLESIAMVRNIFFSTPYSIGGQRGDKIALTRQSDNGDDASTPFNEALHSENSMWVHNGVLFLTLFTGAAGEDTDNCIMQKVPNGIQNFLDDPSTTNSTQTIEDGLGLHSLASQADINTHPGLGWITPTTARNNVFGVPFNPILDESKCSAEFQDRRAANIAWLQKGFKKAKDENLLGVVIVNQAQLNFQTFLSQQSPALGGLSSTSFALNLLSTDLPTAIARCTNPLYGGTVNGSNCTIPLPKDICLPVGAPTPGGGTMLASSAQNCAVYFSLRKALHDEALAFGKPVAILSGDSHFYRRHLPYVDVPNLIAVQTTGPSGSNETGWVNVMVNPTDPKLFTFSTGKCYTVNSAVNPYCLGAGGLLYVTSPASSAMEYDVDDGTVGKQLITLPGGKMDGELVYLNTGGCSTADYPQDGSIAGKIVMIENLPACNANAKLSNDAKINTAIAMGAKALIVTYQFGSIFSLFITNATVQNQIPVIGISPVGRDRLNFIKANNPGVPLMVRLEAGVGSNLPPTAQCKDVTVTGLDGYGIGSIDDGSFDDGTIVSKVQSPSGPYPYGTTQVTLTLTDDQGATSSCTKNVNVFYNTSGFLNPIQNASSDNIGKAGKTYPVQFQLKDANNNLITTTTAVKSIAYKSVTCGTFTNDSTGALSASTAGNSDLRYADNKFIFNWKTPSVKGCYVLFVTLADGQVLTANFNFLK